MLVFVDESGDTGLKIGKGSSAIFTVTLVAIASEETAMALDARIQLLRQELKQPGAFEFHFKENKDAVRSAFLNAVAVFPFSYATIIVDKARLFTPDYTDHKLFHKLVCGRLFEGAQELLTDANVKIDKTGGLDFRRELAAYLKQQTNLSTETTRRIKEVKMEPSHGNNLLQLADMVCGAVHRAHDTSKPHSERFAKIIQHREYAMLYLPEKASPPTIGEL